MTDTLKPLRDALEADKAMDETMITDVNIGRGSVGIQLEGGAAGLLANAFAEQFKESGATNYLEVSFHHKDIGGLMVTMQRTEGKTPHMLRVEAEKERDALLARLDAAGSGKVLLSREVAERALDMLGVAESLCESWKSNHHAKMLAAHNELRAALTQGA